MIGLAFKVRNPTFFISWCFCQAKPIQLLMIMIRDLSLELRGFQAQIVHDLTSIATWSPHMSLLDPTLTSIENEQYAPPV